MSTNLPIADQITHCTVRIECAMPDNTRSTGTAFFFRYDCGGGRFAPVLVTNRHVVDGATAAMLRLSVRGADNLPVRGKHVDITIPQVQELLIGHPDPDVDLCALPVAQLILGLTQADRPPFFITLEGSLVMSQRELDDLTELEEIVMVGYPNGIWDSVNNRPIIRKGITATHPALDYDGRKEFMIDAACFPGSSGSPIFLYNQGAYAGRDGGLTIGSRVKLLGVLYAGPQHMAEGDIQIVSIATQPVPVLLTSIPNNLGVVIRAERLLDFGPLLTDLINRAEANKGA